MLTEKYVIQRLGADGEVRQSSFRTAADSSAERRPSGFISYGGRHFRGATALRVHFVRRQTLQVSDSRQGSFRTATDTSAERGRTGVVGFKTVVLRLGVSSSGRRFDAPRQPSIVFLEYRQP